MLRFSRATSANILTSRGSISSTCSKAIRPRKAFGDSIATLGIGTYLNHARNKLEATRSSMCTITGKHKINDKQKLSWGVNFQRDHFRDVLSEWKMIDSAGYSLPHSTNGEIHLFETVKSQLNLDANRVSGYMQYNGEWARAKKDYIVTVKQHIRSNKSSKTIIHTDTIANSFSRFLFTMGVRAGYTEVNQEAYVTPRMSLVYFPRQYFFNKTKIRRRNSMLKLSTGLYYQPPVLPRIQDL